MPHTSASDRTPTVDVRQPRHAGAHISSHDGPDRGQLWQAHARDLTQFASLLVGPHDAHDVVSIAFHRVMTAIDGGRVPTNVRGYLMRTVANVATDQRRSARRRQARDLHAVARAADRGEPSGPERFALGVDLRRAVADLSVQQRAVIYFTYWEDLDSRQVADLLDIAPATVRRHLARARLHLRRELS